MYHDDYDEIYDPDEWIERENDPEDVIDELRGTIEYGDCIYCGAADAMKYEGNVCFICSKCGKSTPEDIYYRWFAGYPVEFED